MWRKIGIPKLTKWQKGGILLLCMAFAGLTVYGVHASKILMPGETSGMAPLNTPLQGYVSHSEFEKECTHCHAAIHCTTDTNCQDCHADVAKQRAELTGVHGRLPGTEKCATCHPEHLGREVVITDFAFNNVDHDQMAGFGLGSHKVDYQNNPMTCESCHSQDRYSHETLDCLSCHVEQDHAYMAEHVDVYGVDCTRCHNGNNRLADFNHEEVYVLDGAHQQAQCADCHSHQMTAETIEGCSSCHEDPTLHAGQFGLDCTRCHNTTAWQATLLTVHFIWITAGQRFLNATPATQIPLLSGSLLPGCHDHQPADMEAAHLKEGITEYEVRPVPSTGKAGEAAELERLYGDFSLIRKARTHRANKAHLFINNLMSRNDRSAKKPDKIKSQINRYYRSGRANTLILQKMNKACSGRGDEEASDKKDGLI